MKIERVEAIYSQGTSSWREDGLIIAPPFFGVIDGFSEPYSPSHPQFMFGNLSGGEMVRQTVLSAFQEAYPKTSLEDVILDANSRVESLYPKLEGPADAGRLGGCCFALAKGDEEFITVVQGGDCLVVWWLSSGKGVGKCEALRNQAYVHVLENLETIAELMQKHHGDRAKMWDEFYPILKERRRADINNPNSDKCYAVINGQLQLSECWQTVTIPTEELTLLLLLTDGLLPYEETREETNLLKVITYYAEGGLPGILNRKRRVDKARESMSHISQDEATGLAIVFS